MKVCRDAVKALRCARLAKEVKGGLCQYLAWAIRCLSSNPSSAAMPPASSDNAILMSMIT